jgi:hypothetical protein
MPMNAAAISNEDLRPQLSKTQLTAQDISSLMRSEEWNAIESRYAQIVFLIEFAQTECDIALDNWILANIFQLTPHRVHEIRLKV